MSPFWREVTVWWTWLLWNLGIRSSWYVVYGLMKESGSRAGVIVIPGWEPMPSYFEATLQETWQDNVLIYSWQRISILARYRLEDRRAYQESKREQSRREKLASLKPAKPPEDQL